MALERPSTNAIDPSFESMVSVNPEPVAIPKPLIETLIFSAPEDPRRESLTREERIRLNDAQALADENFEDLTPRYRPSDYEPDNSSADWLVADPLGDPEVGRLASLIKATNPKKT